MADPPPPPASHDAPPDWDALARYLAGESPADEARAVSAWVAAHPSDARLLAALDGAVEHVAAEHHAADDVDVEAALRRARTRRGLERVTSGVLPTRPSVRSAERGRALARWSPNRTAVGLAAAAVLAVLAVLALALGARVAWRGDTAVLRAAPPGSASTSERRRGPPPVRGEVR